VVLSLIAMFDIFHYNTENTLDNKLDARENGDVNANNNISLPLPSIFSFGVSILFG